MLPQQGSGCILVFSQNQHLQVPRETALSQVLGCCCYSPKCSKSWKQKPSIVSHWTLLTAVLVHTDVVPVVFRSYQPHEYLQTTIKCCEKKKKYKLCYQTTCIHLWNLHKINCRGGRKHLQEMKRLGKIFYEHEIALQTDGSSLRYNAHWTSRNNTKRRAQQRIWPRFSAAQNPAASKRACYRPLTLEGALSKWLLGELLSVASDGTNAPLFSFPNS